MEKVIVVIGAGSIGQAIARRVSAGKLVLLADLKEENAAAAAKTLSDAGFSVTTTTVDVSKRVSVHALAKQASSLGEVFGVIHAAGVSPSRLPQPPSCRLICMGRRLCWKNSARSLLPAGPAW